MAKAFRRLEKQVEGRRNGVKRVVSWQARLRALEVFALELGAYIRTVAVDAQSPVDQNFVEASTEFQKHLEGVIS